MSVTSNLKKFGCLIRGLVRPAVREERRDAGCDAVQIEELSRQLDLLKSKLELPADQWYELQRLRCELTPADDPLVSVCVATHNRADLLTERCLPSLLEQTYRNLEIIVVADNCTDDTAARVARLNDDRIRFRVLQRKRPPLDDPFRRWAVSGCHGFNAAQDMATGDYITYLDDDDEHLPQRVEKLVTFAQEHQADLVYHPFWHQQPDGAWTLNPADKLQCGQVTTSSVFYRRWLRHIRWDSETHLLLEPVDWNRIRRIIYAGAKCVRHPDPLLVHYRERNQARTRAA